MPKFNRSALPPTFAERGTRKLRCDVWRVNRHGQGMFRNEWSFPISDYGGIEARHDILGTVLNHPMSLCLFRLLEWSPANWRRPADAMSPNTHVLPDPARTPRAQQIGHTIWTSELRRYSRKNSNIRTTPWKWIWANWINKFAAPEKLRAHPKKRVNILRSMCLLRRHKPNAYKWRNENTASTCTRFIWNSIVFINLGNQDRWKSSAAWPRDPVRSAGVTQHVWCSTPFLHGSQEQANAKNEIMNSAVQSRSLISVSFELLKLIPEFQILVSKLGNKIEESSLCCFKCWFTKTVLLSLFFLRCLSIGKK